MKKTGRKKTAKGISKGRGRHGKRKDIASEKMKKEYTLLAAGIAVILIATAFSTWFMFDSARKAEIRLREASRPAKLVVTVIDYQCPGCMNTSEIFGSLEGYGNITERRTANGSEAEMLERKFNISSLPAIILEGETDREIIRPVLQRLGAREYAGAAIVEDNTLPYYSIPDGRVVGLVDIKLVGCDGCADISMLPEVLNSSGVYVRSIQESDGTGYNLSTKPAVIFSSDISLYPGISGLKRQGNEYIYEPLQPPFLNLSTGELVGLVDVIYITAERCNSCYNVSVHKQILSANGVKFRSEKTVDMDSPEGRELIAKYNITALPTILLSKEFKYYPLARGWQQIGTVEDGWYVFRSTSFMEQAGGYINATQ